MTPSLPTPGSGPAADLHLIGSAGPLWRVWHPSGHTPSAATLRNWGPIARFDPQPAGPPVTHHQVWVWYGSHGFDVSALEVFARGGSVAEICPTWRGSLIDIDDAGMVDLTSEQSCGPLGASPRLGDTNLDAVGYDIPQSWGRHLQAAGADGVVFRSCRAAPHGVNTVVYEPSALSGTAAQHRLIDDALYPFLLVALDAAGVGIRRVDRCGRCGPPAT
ncbi:MAG: RES domain-containing protein [Euzebya sp.]